VPVRPVDEDCEHASSEFVVSEGLGWLSPDDASNRADRGVIECVARNDARQRITTEDKRRFEERLRAGALPTGRIGHRTKIVPLLKRIVAQPYVRAIDVLTDGIDNSGVSRSSLRIPVEITVTLIITRPDPTRAKPTLDDVLAAADAWSQEPRVSVTSVAEYTGFVRLMGGHEPCR
jgi:hypothetical protein